jgi:putative transposase
MNAFFNIAPNVVVERKSDGARYVITHILAFESVLGRSEETGKIETLHIPDLRPIADLTKVQVAGIKELSLIEQEDWNHAENVVDNVIRPLLTMPGRTRRMVEEAAGTLGVHPATIYRWIDRFEESGRTSVFVPGKHDGGAGKGRLQSEVEAIVKEVINTLYVKQRQSLKKTYNEVKRRCSNAQLDPPHFNTVYNRIKVLLKIERDEHDLGSGKAEKRNTPFPGHFPGADFPLAVIQIDHTLMDIILVDDIHRLPLKRPWITLAIEVFSRMVMGFFISFDRPNDMSVGLCIANAIMPKEPVLARYGITAEWPCWGVMAKIHADNAGEFRSKMLKRACKEYGIDLAWRPVKKPHYGAHIERLLGTFAEELKALPGATYSNPDKRAGKDSEKDAGLKKSEFEKILLDFITSSYHQREHSALLTSPIKKYEKGIFGTDDVAGRGFPLKVLDEDRLLIDLTPYIERSVQEYGVAIDHIHYYGDVLKRYVNAFDPDNSKLKRQFLIRRNPHDISFVYFYDPELNEYFKIPYRDTSHPPISIWEYRAIRKQMRAEGIKDIDESKLFECYARMLEDVDRSRRETKRVRLEEQRRRDSKQIPKAKTADDRLQERALVNISAKYEDEPFKQNVESDISSQSASDITPFDEIEELDEPL